VRAPLDAFEGAEKIAKDGSLLEEFRLRGGTHALFVVAAFESGV